MVGYIADMLTLIHLQGRDTDIVISFQPSLNFSLVVISDSFPDLNLEICVFFVSQRLAADWQYFCIEIGRNCFQARFSNMYDDRLL